MAGYGPKGLARALVTTAVTAGAAVDSVSSLGSAVMLAITKVGV